MQRWWSAVVTALLVGCTVHYYPAGSSPPDKNKPSPARPKAQPKSPKASSKTHTPRTTTAARAVKRRTPPPNPGDTIIAPPPSLAFSRKDLGTPYTADFKAIRGPQGASVFPRGEIIEEERTRYDGYNITIDDLQQFKAHAGGWGIEASAGVARSRRFGVRRAVQVSRCEWIDDRTTLRNPPRGAVYYPAAVCYGFRYEAVLEGNRNQFNAGVKAKFLSYSGGLDSFTRNHKLRLTIKAEGLSRKPTCNKVTFQSPEDFVECYTPTTAAPTPIWVEWRVIPNRRAPRRRIDWIKKNTSNCGGVREDCRPCQRWRFEAAEFSGGGADIGSSADIRIVIQQPDGAERTLRGRRPSLKKRPVIAKPGDVIDYYAYDKDIFFDDPLGSAAVNVLEYHRDGRAPGGRLTFVGACEKY